MVNDKMVNSSDSELDILFAQSAQRQKAVEQINRQVLLIVRCDMRIKAVRKWAKLLAICFGLPLMVVIYIYTLYLYTPELHQSLRIAAFVLPLGTIAVFLGKNLRDFSISDL